MPLVFTLSCDTRLRQAVLASVDSQIPQLIDTSNPAIS